MKFMVLTGLSTGTKVIASTGFTFIDDVSERVGTEVFVYRKIFYAGTPALKVRETIEEILAKVDSAAAAEFAAMGQPQ